MFITEPNMIRPFRVPAGKLVGVITIVLSRGMLAHYMPGMPSALVPIEWWIFLGWTVLGGAMYGYASMKNPGKSKEIMDHELHELKIINQQWLKENPYK